MEDKIEEKTEVHAEKCPVCNGFGTLRHGTKTCDACKGKCYILVPNKLEDVDNG